MLMIFISSRKVVHHLYDLFGGRKDVGGSAPASLLPTSERKRPQSFSRPTLSKLREPRRITSGSARMERSASGGGEEREGSDYLARQNTDLRRRLEDERDTYKRRIDEYKNKQQQQADLVAKLQSKLVQYKRRCTKLEEHLEPELEVSLPCSGGVGSVVAPAGSALEAAQQHLRELGRQEITDLDTALSRLQDERNKCEKVMHLNNVLRKQLEEALENNEALTTDLHKLSLDFGALQEELIMKEDEWKDEEQYFNDYYTYEHGRLMSLWKGVVDLKRQFTDMQTSTHRDLVKMRTDFASASSDLTQATVSLEARQAYSHLAEEQQKQSALNEVAHLKDILASLKSEYESTQLELRAKDDRVEVLTRELQQLEERCGAAEEGMGDVARMQSELEMLQNTLREVAHAVLQHAESDSTHVHLTPPQPIPPRSPKRTPGGARAPTSSVFAESTISAVQASLHKYRRTIHELQVKVEGNKDQMGTMKRHLDSADEAKTMLETRVAELTSQLDALRSQANQLSQERETLIKSLESARAEKKALDNNRIEISAMLETVNSDLEKLQKANLKMRKVNEALEDEKVFLNSEIERLNKDSDMRNCMLASGNNFDYNMNCTESECSSVTLNVSSYSPESSSLCLEFIHPALPVIQVYSVAKEINLRGEEERSSRLKEELLNTKEELHKIYLTKELLEQQKAEADSILSQLDKSRGDIEVELEQILMDKSEIQDSLSKAEVQISTLEIDKKKLQDEVKKLEDIKTLLQNQVQDQSGDMGSMRKEILQAEQLRLDLESEKVTLQEKCKFLEMEKEKLEVELNQVSRERNELSSQLVSGSKKREGLGEELTRIKQRLEQANENNARINRNLEDLVKDCEDKQVALENNEKEIQRLQELLASLRAEKESLESTLFDVQTSLEACDNRRGQLEKDQSDLLITQESLRGEITRLKGELENCERRSQETRTTLMQQASTMEGEFRQTIASLKRKHEEHIHKLTEEREQVRRSLEKKLEITISSVSGEKDGEIRLLEEKMVSLQHQMDTLCQQHEEELLRAEQDKQQALLIAHHDQQAIQEKLEELKREFEGEKAASERLKRDSSSKAETDRGIINQLRDNVTLLQTKFEQMRENTEKERNLLETRLVEMMKERDGEMQNCEEMKLQLHLAEDRVDSLQAQLTDTNHRLKDIENNRDSVMKELNDTRRQLADVGFEKDKYANSNKELREHVKRAEGQRREQARHLEESNQKIAMLEDNRSSLDAERGRLVTLMRELERNLVEKKHEAASLSEEMGRLKGQMEVRGTEEKQMEAKLEAQAEERDRARQQAQQLSKQVQELEGACEALKQEVVKTRSRGDEDVRRWENKQAELLIRLDESRGMEKKLHDQAHNLEVCLADATQQIHELKARLGGSEGRVRALEAQLAQLENTKRETDQRLSSVGSILRRIAGIQPDGSLNLTYKLLSPTRKWSPGRSTCIDSETGRSDPPFDVDPEAVRKGVRSLMHQVARIERERDDLKMELADSKRQHRETAELAKKHDLKAVNFQAALRQAQEEKGSIEAKLAQRVAELASQTELVSQKSEEAKRASERITELELATRSASDDKTKLEEKLEKIRQAFVKSENEKRILQEDIGRVEGRATKLELQRLGMEGDIQRLQMMLQEKEGTIQKLQERVDAERSTVVGLEERCASLKTTMEELSSTLERASRTEQELRNEVNSLQRTLGDTSASSQANTDKIRQLQKALSNAENERRVFSERFESSQNSIQDIRRNYQVLKEAHSKLQSELAACEVDKSGLEAQLRMANTFPSDANEIRDHNMELKLKIDSLQDKIRQLESEKRTLERKVVSCRSRSFERSEKGSRLDLGGAGDSAANYLDQENRELKSRIRFLENELADKETELARLRAQQARSGDRKGDVERYKEGQVHAERLLEAREQSHRQQVLRLENQIKMLREQLNQEVKLRQRYLMKSARAGREVQELHEALGTSLRKIEREGSGLDANLLETEARRLDTTLASTSPLPLPPPR